MRCAASQQDTERASSDLGDSAVEDSVLVINLSPAMVGAPVLQHTKISLRPNTVATQDLKPRKRNARKLLKGTSPNDRI